MHRDSSKCDVNLCSVVSQVLFGAQKKGTEAITKIEKNKTSKISHKKKNYKKNVAERCCCAQEEAANKEDGGGCWGEEVLPRESCVSSSYIY